MELNMLTIHSGGPLVFSTFSNVILMLRVHALYNRSRGGEWMLLAMIGVLIVLRSFNNPSFLVGRCVIQNSLFEVGLTLYLGHFAVCTFTVVALPPEENIGSVIHWNTNQ